MEDENGNSTSELWALRDVSFEIKKGEHVGIIGPNGSGKSTLLKVLAGITKPSSGEVHICGRVASILDIGTGFHPELSGRENVFLNGQIHGFSRKEIQTKFDDIVAFSGIKKFIDEPVKNYSNGMYLRLAFSIMAHLDFDIYLFDEVLSVGDAEFQLETRDITSKLLKKGGTIINVSHVLSESRVDYSKVLFFKTGNLEKIGTTEVLNEYQRDNYNKFFEIVSKPPFYVFKEIQFKNAEIELLNYGIKEESVLEDGLCSFQSFKLFFEVHLLEDISFTIGVKFFDISNNLLFIITSLSKKAQAIEKKGKYLIEFAMPKSILNSRIYFAELFLSKGEDELILKEEAFLLVKVSDRNLVNQILHPIKDTAMLAVPFEIIVRKGNEI
ncbi:hypothetical protein GCM10009118_32770 [Wandonia haliotis]|uniref:ABC transporter domain-containing protein n=1 Tax=Wandonia haliotis TaxID=574963 RepID=A0ABP3Y7W6_9FLAO